MSDEKALDTALDAPKAPIVEELKAVAAKLGCDSAKWEWSVIERGSPPRLDFLKITLLRGAAPSAPEKILSTAGVHLFQAHTAISDVTELVDYCQLTRALQQKANKIPFGELGFKLGPHTVELYGSFIGQSLDLYGTSKARRHAQFTSDRPFFTAQYSLDHTAKFVGSRDFSLRSGNPAFGTIREAYKHIFATDIGEGRDAFFMFVIPVDVAHIKSFEIDDKSLRVELSDARDIEGTVTLSVICRKDEQIFNPHEPVTVPCEINFTVGFSPASVDLTLFFDELPIDEERWVERTPVAPLWATPQLTQLLIHGSR